MKKFIVVIVVFVFVACAVSLKKGLPNEKTSLIYKNTLESFSSSDEFRMMPAISCNSQGMRELTEIIQNVHADTLIIVCYIGYLGIEKENAKTIKKIADYLKDCVSSTFKERFIVQSIGTTGYIVEKDTVINDIHFKEGENVTKSTYSTLQRDGIMYFESVTSRVEVYSK